MKFYLITDIDFGENVFKVIDKWTGVKEIQYQASYDSSQTNKVKF